MYSPFRYWSASSTGWSLLPPSLFYAHLRTFLIIAVLLHAAVVVDVASGQESINIPSNPKPEFTLANSVLQKATLDKIDRIKKLRDKHQSVGGDHPDMKKVREKRCFETTTYNVQLCFVLNISDIAFEFNFLSLIDV